MIPGATILKCFPSVGKVVSRCNWTLSDAIDAIHVHGLPLSDTVPMNTSSVPSKIVLHLDVNGLQ